jgi:hypothetical protein
VFKRFLGSGTIHALLKERARLHLGRPAAYRRFGAPSSILLIGGFALVREEQLPPPAMRR